MSFIIDAVDLVNKCLNEILDELWFSKERNQPVNIQVTNTVKICMEQWKYAWLLQSSEYKFVFISIRMIEFYILLRISFFLRGSLRMIKNRRQLHANMCLYMWANLFNLIHAICLIRTLLLTLYCHPFHNLHT